MPDTLAKSLAKAGVSSEEIDHLVLHQANQRIIDGAAKKFGLGKEKVVSNIEKYGNTSAGSVPIAMAEAVAEGRIKPGDERRNRRVWRWADVGVRHLPVVSHMRMNR